MLSLWKIARSLQTWVFASCVHGNVLWKHSSCSAWHEIPGVWWGMLSHQSPPITTPRSPPRFVRSLIQMETERRLKGSGDDSEARQWQQSDLKAADCRHAKKENMFDDCRKASDHGCFFPPWELNESYCDYCKKNGSHCVVWRMKLCIDKVGSKIETTLSVKHYHIELTAQHFNNSSAAHHPTDCFTMGHLWLVCQVIWQFWF